MLKQETFTMKTLNMNLNTSKLPLSRIPPQVSLEGHFSGQERLLPVRHCGLPGCGGPGAFCDPCGQVCVNHQGVNRTRMLGDKIKHRSIC